MALFQEQDADCFRLTVRPNCSLSWARTKALFAFFAACLLVVAWWFASLGAWMVLPFAGLELAVLGAGLYFSALAGHRREVIEIDAAELRVLRGGRRLAVIARLPRHWTRASLQADPRRWYPRRVLLTCGGKRLEVGAALVEAEREQLAAMLAERLGPRPAAPERFREDPLPNRLAAAAPLHQVVARRGANVAPDVDAWGVTTCIAIGPVPAAKRGIEGAAGAPIEQ